MTGSHLELDVGLLTHWDVTAKVGVVFVFPQEVVLTNQDLSEPLQDLRVVQDLVLDQLLRDREEHLRTELRRKGLIVNRVKMRRVNRENVSDTSC